MTRWIGLALAALVASAHPALAAPGKPMPVPVRGQTLTITVYRPTGAPRGTVLMGSGDVGWVGLAVNMAEYLSDQGYIVAGVNVRQYLSAFTAQKRHLEAADVPGDYLVIADALRREGLLHAPVIVSGVSEGAGIAVLAAADPRVRQWAHGVITMGLPAVNELAWRWTDFTAWITKSDANEPSFAAKDYIGKVAPLPIYMLQSTKDEYVPAADYAMLEAAAQAPKRQVLIDAANHRFTDRIPVLRTRYLEGLAWIRELAATQ